MKKFINILVNRTCFILLGIIIGITTIGCGLMTPKQQDGELQQYVEDFIKDSKGKIKKSDLSKISLSFESLPKDIAGRCYYVTKQIKIDPKKFYTEHDEITKKAIIYHELGHCYCIKEHNNKKDTNGCPQSIMNWVLPNSKCLKMNWKAYLKELYKGC